MKIKITATQICRRNGEAILSYHHEFDSYEKAFNYLVDLHKFANTLEMSYLRIETEIKDEED